MSPTSDDTQKGHIINNDLTYYLIIIKAWRHRYHINLYDTTDLYLINVNWCCHPSVSWKRCKRPFLAVGRHHLYNV